MIIQSLSVLENLKINHKVAMIGDGINDAIIFHVKFGINGFGVNEYIIPSIIFIFFNLIAFSSSRIFLRNLTDQKTKLITNRTLSLTILVLSIILMATAATLISKWIKDYKWIAWVGLFAILFVAVELIYTDLKLFI